MAHIAVVQKAVGERIRKLREKKGWTQALLATRCHMHRSHMGEVERGETNLTLSTVLVLVDKLDTTVAALFKGIA
jgi:transcriptional regulator with XRE-family HTH domain